MHPPPPAACRVPRLRRGRDRLPGLIDGDTGDRLRGRGLACLVFRFRSVLRITRYGGGGCRRRWLLLRRRRRAGRDRRHGDYQGQSRDGDGDAPKPRHPAFQGFAAHDHENPPIEVRSAKSHPQPGQRRPKRPRPGAASEKLRVILGLRRQAGRLGVGQKILAKPKLPPQPPHQRLIEERGPRQGGQEPNAKVAPLDVRPLVRQSPPQRSLVAAQVFRQHDQRPSPDRRERLTDAPAGQQADRAGPPSDNRRQQLPTAWRRGPSRPDDPRQPCHARQPPREHEGRAGQVDHHDPRRDIKDRGRCLRGLHDRLRRNLGGQRRNLRLQQRQLGCQRRNGVDAGDPRFGRPRPLAFDRTIRFDRPIGRGCGDLVRADCRGGRPADVPSRVAGNQP